MSTDWDNNLQREDLSSWELQIKTFLWEPSTLGLNFLWNLPNMSICNDVQRHWLQNWLARQNPKKAAQLLFIIQPGAESGSNDVLTAVHASKKQRKRKKCFMQCFVSSYLICNNSGAASKTLILHGNIVTLPYLWSSHTNGNLWTLTANRLSWK